MDSIKSTESAQIALVWTCRIIHSKVSRWLSKAGTQCLVGKWKMSKIQHVLNNYKMKILHDLECQ